MSSRSNKELKNNIKRYAHTHMHTHTHIWTEAWMCLDDGREVGSEKKQTASYYITSTVVAENRKILDLHKRQVNT